MSLDLQDVLADWPLAPGESRARLVVGRDGEQFVQMRIDLGLLQMHLDGRPDGRRFHGMSTVLEHARHEVATGRQRLSPREWDELAREFGQFNQRRIALSNVVDQLLQSQSELGEVRPYILRALWDIDACLQIVAMRERMTGEASEHSVHRPVLVFNLARLRTQLRVIDSEYDEAVEEAVRGRHELETLLIETTSLDADAVETDAGVAYLRQLEERVREQYSITYTLREQLEMAIADEDFETAARLRDDLRRRAGAGERRLPPPKQCD